MTGSLLSIVFIHANLSNSLSVVYTVALDYVFYATYLLFTLEMIVLVYAWHRQKTNEPLARKLMLFARILYPVYILIGGMLFLWAYVFSRGM